MMWHGAGSNLKIWMTLFLWLMQKLVTQRKISPHLIWQFSQCVTIQFSGLEFFLWNHFGILYVLSWMSLWFVDVKF
jgi:hypothetical protein